MMEDTWRIELFGGVRARQGERFVNRFRTQKTGALLAYLAYFRGRSHSREVLIQMFWPDASEDSARHSLSLALSSLRGQLEPPGVVAGSVIVADKLSVELNPDAFTTDVNDFEEALRSAAKARSDEQKIESLARALDRYAGELLPGYYEDWIGAEQDRLAGRFFDASHQLAILLEKAGDLPRALDGVRRAVAFDPLRESGQRDLIRLLALLGQSSDALRQYREFAQLLSEEMEEEPSSATQQLIRQIEAQVMVSAPAGGAVPLVTPSRETSPRPAPTTSPSLPTGTVTFLFTDIEGSTALWERAGEAFRPALTLHHSLLRNEFRRAGGYEAKEAGDSFLVAFGSASDALACAVASQRALAAQTWPETVGPLRVRMALHTGDVEMEDNDYHGLPVHRASRILSAAHGGQILCSEAATGLLRRDLEPEVTLTDLGIYRLRDVEGPERLFQVDYPDRPQREFSPLRAERAYAGRLPLQLTRFFGREKELARIEKLFTREKVRLLTLTGPGGTGKTRLGIEAAGRLLDAFGGAVWFVPLADLSDPRLLPDALLDALRVPRGGADPLESVIEVLSQQPSLLLLDNLEQVVDGGAEFIQLLQERVPMLSLLVTSRQVLGLEGEREFLVEPLPTPQGQMDAESLGLYESVRLFVDRAQAVKPDFQVTNGNAPAVADLCNRLEGMPLAIELAAARASVMSPTQMLHQLSNRFEFLVSRRRGVAERQRTLRAAVDWSYRLLAPALQRFFARLSVFRGGWTVEEAEAVCEEPLALDALAQLRESSLVQTETDPTTGAIRFRLLESLREYAAERLSPEETVQVERQHARHFLNFAEEAEPYLTGPHQAAWLTRLEAEHDNFRAALAWCARSQEHENRLALAGALWRFWSVRGHFREGRRMLEEALADSPAEIERSPARALALSGAGALAHDLGDYDAAVRWLEESISLWRERGDRRGLATALNLRANVALDQDAYAQAQELYEEALTFWRALQDIRGQAMTLSNLGALALDAGDARRAEELLFESVRLKRGLGNAYGLAISLETLGNVERSQGKIEQALVLHREALEIRRELGHKQGVAMSLCNVGSALLEGGETEPSCAHLLESLALFEEMEDVRGSLECLSNLAGVASAAGRHEEAARLLVSVESLRQSGGITPSEEEVQVEARVRKTAQDLLPAKVFERIVTEAQRITVEQAREYARGLIDTSVSKK